MGSGLYSFSGRSVRAQSMGYHTKARNDIFTQREVHKDMDPVGIKLREARDSEEHPNSFPIVIALDETGSMGDIPHDLVRDGLPHMMQKVLDKGIKDPQILFIGIGDHKCDTSPLQVGQFESSDELLDKWLTDLYLEGHGGGNDGESYHLAWFFASQFTETDSLDKRGKKGLLVTIGDEPVHSNITSKDLSRIMGSGEYKDYTAIELLASARKKYEVYHLHMLEGQVGGSKRVQDGWKEIMGENVIFVDEREKVSGIIAGLVLDVHGNGKEAKKKEEKAPIQKSEVEEML